MVKNVISTSLMAFGGNGGTAPGGRFATSEEADRLESILKSFSTIEKQDLAILNGAGPQLLAPHVTTQLLTPFAGLGTTLWHELTPQ